MLAIAVSNAGVSPVSPTHTPIEKYRIATTAKAIRTSPTTAIVIFCCLVICSPVKNKRQACVACVHACVHDACRLTIHGNHFRSTACRRHDDCHSSACSSCRTSCCSLLVRTVCIRPQSRNDTRHVDCSLRSCRHCRCHVCGFWHHRGDGLARCDGFVNRAGNHLSHRSGFLNRFVRGHGCGARCHTLLSVGRLLTSCDHQQSRYCNYKNSFHSSAFFLDKI